MPKAKRKSGQSDWSFSQKSPAKSGTQDSTAQNVEDITITDEQTLTDQTKTPVDDQTKSIIKDQTKSIIKDQTKSIINDKTKSILKDKTKSIINEAQAQSCESSDPHFIKEFQIFMSNLKRPCIWINSELPFFAPRKFKNDDAPKAWKRDTFIVLNWFRKEVPKKNLPTRFWEFPVAFAKKVQALYGEIFK